jgi:protein gp37/ParB-like chromosome segregation protein Spo0J
MDSANWGGELAGFEQHPLSAVFPSMPSVEFARLRADIAKHGLRQPIVLHDGQVLDGWHRCRACSETGTEIRTEEFAGDEREALAFVLSANLARRHLTTSDRSLLAAKFATLKWGEKRSHLTPLTIEQAAEHLKVSAGSVTRARKVLKRGDPELIARVAAHELTISKAERLLPRPPQPRVVNDEGYTIEAWRALPEDERAALLVLRNRKARLNRQNATEDGNAIDWARSSYSPITGCKHNCPYCYIGDFVSIVPMFHPDRLAAPLNMAPPASNDPRDRCIFVGSLADLFGRWVPSEWIQAIIDVFRACLGAGWIFIFSTKFPWRYLEFDFPPNCWLGTTIDKQSRVASAEDAFAQLRERDPKRVLFAALEPLLEPITFTRLHLFNRLVLGGASATQHSPAWYPPLRLVDDKRREARVAGCSLYEKSNLLLKESLGGARYEFTDEPPFPEYLGKK